MTLLSFCSAYLRSKGCDFVDMGNYEIPTKNKYINVSCLSESDNEYDQNIVLLSTAIDDGFVYSDNIMVRTQNDAVLVMDTMLSVLSNPS